jgi:hypothetical protein
MMTHCLIGRFMSGGISWPGRVERAAGRRGWLRLCGPRPVRCRPMAVQPVSPRSIALCRQLRDLGALPVGRILRGQNLITESVNLIALRGVLLA